MKLITLFLLFSCFLFSKIHADEIKVAAASNFTETLKQLSKSFEAKTSHKVIMAFASTGKQYAQIIHGAPFDIFLAADTKRPKLLEDAGIALSNSRFTYAVGKLVLWSPNAGLITDNINTLKTKQFRYLAIANPKLAPYGRAAKEILEEHNLWKPLQDSMVRGENIGQTFQFVRTENAQLGFIACSQIKRPNQAIKGSFWIPPQSLYAAINQQAVLLNDNKAAREFLSFIKNTEGQKIIRSFGYGVTESGVTKSGVTESGVTKNGVTGNAVMRNAVTEEVALE